MTIYTPAEGRTVRAESTAGGGLRATLTVTGRADPDTTVLVSSGCAVHGCADLARAKIDGRWEVRVLVAAKRSRPRATVEAVNSADSEDAARVAVRLRGKPLPPARKPHAVTPQPAAPTPLAPTPAAPPTASAARTLVMIGDSLAEGTEPILPDLLPGWQVHIDALESRPLATGMAILARTSLGDTPTVLAFSLFTNDDPHNVGALESAVRKSVARAGPRGCAVWATIVRPPLNGVSYAAANRRLEKLGADPALARHLRIVPWASAVASNPGWLAPDGVHGTSSGYRARAQLYAGAIRACGG
jgi:lysophospholipase L1-like esterase